MTLDYLVSIRLDEMDYCFLCKLEEELMADNRSDTIRQLIRYKIAELEGGNNMENKK